MKIHRSICFTLKINIVYDLLVKQSVKVHFITIAALKSNILLIAALNFNYKVF